MSSDKKLNVFVSYSHDDEPKWLERIKKHLTPLARDGKLDLWEDTRIRSGQQWREEIKAALARADVAVLLISVNFYASDFIDKNELPPLLEAESKRGLVILGVHINYSDFENDPRLSRYQTVNKPNRPIKALRSTADQDKVFLALTRRIRELVPARSAAPAIPPEYLRWLEARCAGVELLGQDVQQGLAIELRHVYVPALTQREATAVDPEEPTRRGLLEPEEQRLVPMLKRVDEGSLYVPAAAGAGKSTFCRWAVLQSISGTPASHPVAAPQEFEEPVSESLRSRLPLLVPLRDFGKDMDCGRGRPWHRTDLEQALARWVDRLALPGLDGAMLKAHLAAGSAFLLLDGLDEVAISETQTGTTVYPRALLLSGLADALPVWEAAGNRTLLTSRPYGLDEASLDRLRLPRALLEPLPESLQKLFVRRWFHTLKREQLAGDLLEAMGSRDDLAPLTENPLLLTAICVLYDKGGRLPEDRYQLYKSIVDGVLHSRYPGGTGERGAILRRLEAIAYGMHTGEPDEAPRPTPTAEISWVETEQLLADFAEKNPSLRQGEVAAAVQRDELLTRSGLLLPRPNERAAFYHLSFQEFLAAQRIVRTSDDLKQVFVERGIVPEWRPTLLFLFAAQIFNRDAEWGLRLLARLLDSQDRAAVKANPAPAVFIAEALELCLAKRYQIPEALAENFRRLSLGAIESEVEVQARQTLGLCLGRLGDPRIFDLRDPGAYVEVPAGTYPYGEKKGTTVKIEAPFLLGRYPVTNGQYQAFIDDNGYGDRKWWSDAGWEWLRKEGVTEPRYWRDRRWNAPNQPVVGVSFFEAAACCAWAGGRLPREQEWEAAARGPDGSPYPWGDDWADGICNIGLRLNVTSPVGLFARSRLAQLGLEDLAGNVWEWCATIYNDPDDAAPFKNPEAERVLRGGAWDAPLSMARCDFRLHLNPRFRVREIIGFRVVCPSIIRDH